MTDDFYRNVELYKRGLYEHIHFRDKITNQLFKFHRKQIKTIEYLNDPTATYVGYGGAARGGKSALISTDAILCAYVYPECVNLIGRKNLTVLWETTWKTLLRNLDNFGFVDGVDYRYNGQRHELTFANKSIIIAKNLELKPSDTEATEFGSLEILRAYIDQSEHVPLKIIEKVGERVGSHFTSSQYGLKGKVLEAFNPSGSHVKRRYWTPFKTNSEKQTRKFVQALPTDNPGKEAVEWVNQKEKDFKDGTMSLVEYQKQIKGNFDFDDDPNSLCNYQNIIAMFSNNHIKKEGEKYITADIARLGSDKAIVFVWCGYIVVEKHVFKKSKTTEIQSCIQAMRTKHTIASHNCVADEDGVGGGVVDNLDIKGFVNNARPFKEETKAKSRVPQYKNLKTQCAYKFAELVNKHLAGIDCDLSESERQEIIEEVDQLKSYKLDDDGKLRIKPKSKIKEDLGRSPDWLDTLFMRMYFDLAPKSRYEFTEESLQELGIAY